MVELLSGNMIELFPGDLFDNQYVLVQKIGASKLTEVWQASHGNRQVALKTFAAVGEKGQKLALEEFAKACKLDHPHLLKPVNYGVYKNQPYTVAPFYKQGAVSKRAGDLTEKELAVVFNHISSALNYLHTQSYAIVHLGVHPNNFLMDENGNYRLSDYAWSRRLRRICLQNALSNKDVQNKAASLNYCPPEYFTAAENDLAPRRKADVWGLGASMHELAAGRTPFPEKGGRALQQSAPVPELFTKKYSKGLKDLIKTCLNPDPHLRPTAHLVESWSSNYLNNGSWDLKSGTLETFFEETRKKRTFFFGSVVAVALLIFSTLSFLFFFNAPQLDFSINSNLSQTVELQNSLNTPISFQNKSKTMDSFSWRITDEAGEMIEMETFEFNYLFPKPGVYTVLLTGRENETKRSVQKKLKILSTSEYEALVKDRLKNILYRLPTAKRQHALLLELKSMMTDKAAFFLDNNNTQVYALRDKKPDLESLQLDFDEFGQLKYIAINSSVLDTTTLSALDENTSNDIALLTNEALPDFTGNVISDDFPDRSTDGADRKPILKKEETPPRKKKSSSERAETPLENNTVPAPRASPGRSSELTFELAKKAKLQMATSGLFSSCNNMVATNKVSITISTTQKIILEELILFANLNGKVKIRIESDGPQNRSASFSHNLQSANAKGKTINEFFLHSLPLKGMESYVMIPGESYRLTLESANENQPFGDSQNCYLNRIKNKDLSIVFTENHVLFDLKYQIGS